MEAGTADDTSEVVEGGACVVVASWAPTAVGSTEGKTSVDDGHSNEVSEGAGPELESTASAVDVATVTEGELVSTVEVVVQ